MLLLTKAVLAIFLGFLLSAILGAIILPILRHFHIKQNISSFVGLRHVKKEGTPTMGGLIFIIPTLLATIILLLFDKISYTSNLGIVLLVFIGYALIGFLDDFISIKRHNNDGLTVYQKLILQVLIAIGFFYIYMRSGGQTSWVVATLHIDLEMTWLYGIFILLILVGFSNAVNLTDGLDGLAGGLSAIAFLAFSLISLTVGFEDIGIFSLILMGSLLGFLIFNTHPAKVFMGDTGSLALGGVMGAIAILTHRELTLFVVAGVFIIEILTVVIQTISMITTHKKIFLMTPLHHHFEKLGWNENDIVKLFWIVGLVFAMAGIIFGVWI